MKPSSVKGKGRYAENAVAAYMKETYWPYAERRRMKGSMDMGDVLPGNNAPLVVEVKNAKTSHIPAWLRETEAERLNANADIGLLVVKPKGMGAAKAPLWHAYLPADQYAKLDVFNSMPPALVPKWQRFEPEAWLCEATDWPVTFRPRGWQPGELYPVLMRLDTALAFLQRCGYGS